MILTLNAIIESENLDAYLDLEAYAAYGDNLGLDAKNFADWQEEAEEAYAGQFSTDEDFAENRASELGLINEIASWPNNCIDWTHAAREIMYDYLEQDGYYFRNM